jgi:hypothetical protein
MKADESGRAGDENAHGRLKIKGAGVNALRLGQSPGPCQRQAARNGKAIAA